MRTTHAGKRFGGEVINADAMQVYRGLPIVTNVASEAERCGVPHHVLEVADPLTDKPYTVHDYLARAMAAVVDVARRGKLPVIVGGTNYYVEALLYRDALAVETHSDSDDGDGDAAVASSGSSGGLGRGSGAGEVRDGARAAAAETETETERTSSRLPLSSSSASPSPSLPAAGAAAVAAPRPSLVYRESNSSVEGAK